MLYQKILEERCRLQKQMKDIELELNKLPNGKFICTRGQNCYKWYVSDGHKQIYIPKRKRKYAEQLASRRYLTQKLEFLTKEVHALDFYLRHSPNQSDSDRAESLLMKHSGYQELLLPHFKPKAQLQQEWADAQYERNTKYPEHLIHKTSTGDYVRSKSEAMIARALHTNRIPFRYECALTLGSITLYPDFTILHPETSELFYWEHFGRMDESTYTQKTFKKLQLYTDYGIVPTIHLIATYETSKHPLNYEDICEVAKNYFL